MDTLKNIKIPGSVWALLLVGGSVFLQANFEETEWLSLVLVVVAAVVKWLQVTITVNSEEKEVRRMRSAGLAVGYPETYPPNKQSKFSQWLLG